MIVPGWGYFYTRHPVLGIMEAVMETFFTSMLTVLALAYFNHLPIGTRIYGDGRSLGQAVLLCAFIIVFEKFVTILFANKAINEFIPSKNKVEVQSEEIEEYRSSPKFEDLREFNWRSR